MPALHGWFHGYSPVAGSLRTSPSRLRTCLSPVLDRELPPHVEEARVAFVVGEGYSVVGLGGGGQSVATRPG